MNYSPPRSLLPSSRTKPPGAIGCILYSLLFLLAIGIVGNVYLKHANYRSALNATQEWARLNDFPETATNVSVATEGNMFSRELTVDFDAPVRDIENWLNQSPGTNNVTPTRNGRIWRYEIEPGGGAQSASLEFDEKNGHIRIHTFWS